MVVVVVVGVYVYTDVCVCVCVRACVLDRRWYKPCDSTPKQRHPRTFRPEAVV